MPAAQSALVIGGGIAGPVAATALRMAGIDAAVYEARPSDPASASGIGGSLAPGREMPMAQGLPPRQLIDRGTLHRILKERAEQAGVRIHHDKKLIRVDDHRDGVTAHYADGSTATADVLIGADGVHSAVRRLIDPDAPSARYLGLLGFEGVVDDVSDDPVTSTLETGTMVFAFGRRAYYLYWKRPDGRIGWGANLPSPQYMSLKDARAVPAGEWLHLLRSAYADDVPGARLAAETTSETLQAVGGLHIMPPVPHWHRGRMVLVGDSVHAPSNSTGQGASLAMESAIELARCLRDLPDTASAFAAYERLRRSRVEKIAARGARISHAKAPGPIAQRMMRLLLPVMMATMNIETTMAAEQRYTIDWDERFLSPSNV